MTTDLIGDPFEDHPGLRAIWEAFASDPARLGPEVAACPHCGDEFTMRTLAPDPDEIAGDWIGSDGNSVDNYREVEDGGE
jgi:hypothetical protein